MNPLLHAATAIPLVMGLSVALLQDVASRRVANVITVPLALAGLLAWTMSHGASGFAQSIAGLIACLAFGILPFSRGWLGGGDVKLLSAAGAWVGIYATLKLLLLTAICGGVVSAVALVATAPTLVAMPRLLIAQARHAKAPYAVAIAAGTILTLLEVL